jgi:hypothetical protein
MRYFRWVIGLGLIALLSGCVTLVPDPLQLDQSNSAELEFVKGHESAGLGHAAAEFYMVCVTSACNERRFSVPLTWTTPNSIVRRVRSGGVIVSAGTMNIVGRTQDTCNFLVGFNVETGHSYTVEIYNHFGEKACLFRVTDRATGAFVPISKISRG